MRTKPRHQDTDKPSASTAAEMTTVPAVDLPDPVGAPATRVPPDDRGRAPGVTQLTGRPSALGDWWDYRLPIPRRRPSVVERRTLWSTGENSWKRQEPSCAA